MSSPSRAERTFLPEVQGLRALAVTLVVLFHLWPIHMPGGFAGVDAFFVISGFLITSHLLREVDQTGRVRLAAFYARRARRLLPASLTVLVCCLVAGLFLLPVEMRSENAVQVAASGFYVQNLYLAAQAVTYSGSNDIASAVEHFWSLSAEEQFYLIWPSLILLALLISRRVARRRPMTTIGAVLVVLTLVSLLFSIWFTGANRSAAYFVTPTRAWEFGIGAITSLVMRRWRPRNPAATAFRWLGAAGLLWTGFTFTQQTPPFPGSAAALPCLATALIIVAGDTGRDPSNLLVNWRPIQWLGDVSYSVYLWHWPLIAFLPYTLGHPLTTWDKVAILMATGLLAHLSWRYVENATRFAPPLVRSPRLALSAALAGMLVIAAGTGATLLAANRQEAAVAQAIDSGRPIPCVGAAALAPGAHCPDATTAQAVTPVVKADAPWAPIAGCRGLPGAPEMRRCYFGTGQPVRTIALIGDSHAEHWRRALEVIAKQKNWAFIEAYAGGCPATYGSSVMFEGKPRSGSVCRDWTRAVTQRLQTLKPSLILTTAYVRSGRFDPPDSGPAGFVQVWRDWQRFAKVVAIRDIPSTGNKYGPVCLAQHPGNPRGCSTPRAQALLDDDLVKATRLSGTDGAPVQLLDLSDYFCDPTTCYAVVGGVPVYYDWDHMTAQFSVSLAPYLAADLPT